MTRAPSYAQIIRQTLPIILANSTTPLLGLVDTAVIGHYGQVHDLAAIALGSLLFSFLFWGFGFLRMNTSGYSAQAVGRNDDLALVAGIGRGLLLALVIGGVLLLLQWPLITLALQIFAADPGVEAVTADYFYVRIWSAPATLALYVLMGYMIGVGASRQLLLAQLLVNGLNILFDLLFAGVLGWGAAGIALGTALAEWLALLLVGGMVWRQLAAACRPIASRLAVELRDWPQLRQLIRANTDILLRTLALLAGFGIFTDQGARFGATTLAANHLLLQLVSFSAFFLDGFAYVAESLTGRALGARDRPQFSLVVRRTSILAATSALLLAVAIWQLGPQLILQLTELDSVNRQAQIGLPYCAGYVLLSFAAFQLDGVFIGTTQSRALRDAAILALLVFAGLCWLLVPALGNQGLWLAFIGFVVLRAIMLGLFYPRLLGQVGSPSEKRSI